MRRRLAALFAHPDDDTFSLAGSLALHRGEIDVMTVLATSGEAGEIFDASLATRETLGVVREEEARAAYAAVGVEPDMRLLRHPDGGLAGVPRERLVDQLSEALRGFRPEVVVTFGPEGVTAHEDHVAVHHAATEAFERVRGEADSGAFLRLLYSSIPRSRIERFRELQRAAGQDPFDPDEPFAPRGVPDETIAITVDCSAVWESVVDALRAHRTQAAELEGIPPEARPLVFGEENFVQAWPERDPAEGVLPDIFTGLPEPTVAG
jgi:LmbE family N-acetylglucosaminyl deacetylase